MRTDAPAAWAAHLRRLSEPVTARWAAAPPPRRLGAGALDLPFIRAVSGRDMDVEKLTFGADRPEVTVWEAVTNPDLEVDSKLTRPEGALLERGLYAAIEVWTDAELCSLHALWTLAGLRSRPDWRARAEAARDWHVLHTQPDNATNRPWALHVFLLSSAPEGRHYAETLLHNALALAGEPEPLSAWILLDAARHLEAAGAGA